MRLDLRRGRAAGWRGWVHAGDRQGLERLCRYGSRGQLALERLCVGEDGRYEYRTRKGQVLRFTAEELVKRLVALIPPARTHLTRFHGVFAPHARLRARLVLSRPEGSTATPAASGLPFREGAKARGCPKPPRLDWAALQRRTYGEDVWRCPCGGKRRVLAVVTSRRTAEELLARLIPGSDRTPRPLAHSPPQLPLAL